MDEFLKPTDIESYKAWLNATKKVSIDQRIENHYELQTENIKKQFEESDFWQEFIKNFENFNIKYLSESKGYNLFLKQDGQRYVPKLEIKPYNSIIDKSFRKNVVNNTNFPKEPENGWVLPENWHLKINDVVRTSIAVKYLDGVDFLLKEFDTVCNKYDKKCSISREARWEGYYAVHISVPHKVKITNLNMESYECEIFIEIQITTQLQEIIKNLLHKYYNENRSQASDDPADKEKWKWDYKSEEFATNYLGHILHYVEGMIMEIRERQKNDGDTHEN
jgi:hypothetical protein